MSHANPSWLRRHRRAVRALCGAGMLVTGGYALADAVENVRSAARRSSDL